MNNTLTPQQQELLNKLTDHKLTPGETLSLLFSMFLPFIPYEWRLNIYFFLTSFTHNWPSYLTILVFLIFLIGFIALCIVIGVIVMKFWLIKRDLGREDVLLELKPPHNNLQSAYATQELFIKLHNLASPKTWLDRLLRKRKQYSLEITAEKDEGIRYFIQVPKEDKESIKKSILSYLPSAKIIESKDHLPKNLNSLDKSERKLIHFNLSNKFAYPLQEQKTLKEHDPIAYITGNMTKLNLDDKIILQALVTPVNGSTASKANNISNTILNSGDVFQAIDGINLPLILRIPLFFLKLTLFFAICVFTVPFAMFEMFISDGKSGNLFPHRELLFPIKRKVTYNINQQELVQEINKKLDQQLYEAHFRALFLIKGKEVKKEREDGLLASLSSFTNPGFQSIRPAHFIKTPIVSLWKGLNLKIFQARSRFFSPKLVLSVEELADLYHFPYSSTTRTEDLRNIKSKDLPAPLFLKKSSTKLDVIFGENTYGGESTPIGLTFEQRRQHMYIVGATGMGKSTMLSNMIYQDIKNGKGLAVVDPHGDLIENILGTIPKSRIKDVVYFNPDDEQWPIGLNLLEIGKDASSREKDFIASSLISIFQKLYDDPRFWGPKMEYILHNAALTALELEGSTIFTIHALLTDKQFRQQSLIRIKSPVLKNFWKNEFDMAGDYQKVKMFSSITYKIGQFLTSNMTKNILGQKKSTINFDDILNNQKILLCDLSKGKLGEDHSKVLGLSIISKIQLAALKRARMSIDKRKDFYLYIDEFHNFATSSFGQIMSEARKYRLLVIPAHQTMAQIKDHDLIKIILANTGAVICFRTGSSYDEKFLNTFFSPVVGKHEIANLAPHNFYIKINLDEPEDAFLGQSLDFTQQSDSKIIQQVIEYSRKNYARNREEVEKETEEIFIAIPNSEEEPKKPAKSKKKKLMK